jgi:hypothetical protein
MTHFQSNNQSTQKIKPNASIPECLNKSIIEDDAMIIDTEDREQLVVLKKKFESNEANIIHELYN